MGRHRTFGTVTIAENASGIVGESPPGIGASRTENHDVRACGLRVTRSVNVAKHIGIAAVSPEGSVFCYREMHRYCHTLIGDTGHPRVTLHNEPFEQYVAAAMRDDWQTVADMLRRSARALAAAGAEFVITPDNVMQFAVHNAEVGSPIPWLNMTDLVTSAVVNDQRRCVGLIGTVKVMFGATYQTLLGLRGIKVMSPTASDASEIDGIIFRELVHGTVRAQSRQVMLDAIARLADRGAEGVILGCSEAPLLVTAENSPIPVYDAVTLLAEGAVRHSLGVAEPSANVARAG